MKFTSQEYKIMEIQTNVKEKNLVIYGKTFLGIFKERYEIPPSLNNVLAKLNELYESNKNNSCNQINQLCNFKNCYDVKNNSDIKDQIYQWIKILSTSDYLENTYIKRQSLTLHFELDKLQLWPLINYHFSNKNLAALQCLDYIYSHNLILHRSTNLDSQFDNQATKSGYVLTLNLCPLFQTAIDSLFCNIPLVIKGNVSCGKSCFVDYLVVQYLTRVRDNQKTTPKTYKLLMGQHIEAKSLLGNIASTEIPGQFVWVPGILTKAILEGSVLIIDGLEHSNPEVMALLASLLENQEIYIPPLNKLVAFNPNFRIITILNQTTPSTNNRTLFHPLNMHRFFNVIQLPQISKNYLSEICAKKFSSLPQDVCHCLMDIYEEVLRTTHNIKFNITDGKDSVSDYERLIKSNDMANNHSHSRDFFKFAERINLQFVGAVGNDWLITVFLHAYDVFVAHQSQPEIIHQLATVIAARLNIDSQKVSYYLHTHKPSLTITANQVGCGPPTGSILKRAVRHSLALGADGKNKNSPFYLTRQASTVLRATIEAVSAVEPLLLIGETGAGKTSLIQYLADIVLGPPANPDDKGAQHQEGPRLVVINMSNQTEVEDLYGCYRPRTIATTNLVNGDGHPTPPWSTLLKPSLQRFERLFNLTFSRKKNRSYFCNWQKCLATERWTDALYLVTFTYRAATSKLKTMMEESSVSGEREIVEGKRKSTSCNMDPSQLLDEWESFYATFCRLKNYVENRTGDNEGQHGGKAITLFAYVEGIILTAMKRGDWVLLDEINLASVQTLHSILNVLEDRRATLYDRGHVNNCEDGTFQNGGEDDNTTTTKAHPNFRLFACMNPPSRRETQKRNLTYGVRSRFTELYIPELEDRSDLRLLVQSYLGGSSNPIEKLMVENIIDFYLKMRQAVQDGSLFACHESNFDVGAFNASAVDKPVYTLRSLCRSLQLVVLSKKMFKSDKSINDHIFQAFLTIFSSELDKSFAPNLLKFMATTLFRGHNFDRLLGRDTVPGIHPKLSSADRRKKAKYHHVTENPVTADHVCQIAGHEVLKGDLPCLVDENYIFTPSVSGYLQSVVRILSYRRYPILLQGPTSAGKTSLITWLAKATGNKCVRINNHENTEVQDYVGRYKYDEIRGIFYFEEGPLTTAMREGHWIILDELNLASSEVLEALNRVLDDNRQLFIPETCATINAHPRFTVFATQNPHGQAGGTGHFHYGGRKPLSRAFRNRFIQINFTNLPHPEIEMILHDAWHLPLSACKKMVAVMKDLGDHRCHSSIFGGRQGFITLRDLFKWAKRYNEYQHCEAGPFKAFKRDWDSNPLAYIGYMLLGSRCRRQQDLDTVREVVLKHLGLEIDENVLFAPDSHLFTSLMQMLESKGSGDNKYRHLCFTFSLRRMLILAYVALLNQEPVLLVGETGCGKTTICHLLSDLFQQVLYTLNCHQQSDATDFVGSIHPIQRDTDSSMELDSSQTRPSQAIFEWRDGLLVIAMKEGSALLLDEISLAENAVLERLNSVLENDRKLVLVEKGNDQSAGCTEIKAQPTFHLMATMNPGGDYGKKELSPALRNRFTEIWCSINDDRSDDLIAILKHNLSWQTNAEAIPQFFLDFLNHTEAVLLPHRLKLHLSTRDILSFTAFWKTFCQNLPRGQDWLARSMTGLYHAMAITFLERIRLNAFSRNLTQDDIANMLNTSELHLRSSMTKMYEIQDSSALAPQHFETLELVIGGKIFGIEPFYLEIKAPSSEASSPASSFLFETPTTRENIFRILRALVLNKPLLLEGSPGVGKTSIIQAVASQTNNKLVRINLSEQTDVADLFGSNLPTKQGNFEWKDGPFLRALKYGYWILIDEINLASQSILEALNSCFDHRGQIFIPELGKTFNVNVESTKIFGSQNPNFQGGGRKMLPRSFLNRFTHVCIKSMENRDYYLILTKAYPSIDKNIIDKMIRLNFEVQVVGKMQRYSKYWEFNIRDMERWCQLVKHDETVYNLFFGFKLIYAARFRESQDREMLTRLFCAIFLGASNNNNSQDSSSLCFKANPFTFNLDLPNYVGIGMARLPYNDKICTRIGEKERFSLLRQQLPALELVGKCVASNWMPILVGKSGAGKSSLIKLLARLTGNRIVTFSLNYNTDITDLLGHYEQEDTSNVLGRLLNRLIQLLRVLGNRLILLDHEPNAGKAMTYLKGLEEYSRTVYTQDKQGVAVPGLIVEIESWLVEQLSILEEKDEDLHASIVNVREDITALSDLISLKDPKNSFVWVESLLVSALKNGDWLLVENANLCSPAILDRLMPLLEPNGRLEIPERGFVDGTVCSVEMHRDFRIIMTMNPANGDISRAMNNRGIEIYLDPIDFGNMEIDDPDWWCTDIPEILATHYMPKSLILPIMKAHKIITQKYVDDQVHKPSIFEMIKVAKIFISRLNACDIGFRELLLQVTIACYKDYIKESIIEEVSVLDEILTRFKYPKKKVIAELRRQLFDDSQANLVNALALTEDSCNLPQIEAREIVPSWYYKDTLPYLMECFHHRTITVACGPLLTLFKTALSPPDLLPLYAGCWYGDEITTIPDLAFNCNIGLRNLLEIVPIDQYPHCSQYLEEAEITLESPADFHFLIHSFRGVSEEVELLKDSYAGTNRVSTFSNNSDQLEVELLNRMNVMFEMRLGLNLLELTCGGADKLASIEKQFYGLTKSGRNVEGALKDNHGCKNKIQLYDLLTLFAHLFYKSTLTACIDLALDYNLLAELGYSLSYAIISLGQGREANNACFDLTLGICKVLWIPIQHAYTRIIKSNDGMDSNAVLTHVVLKDLLKIEQSSFSTYFDRINFPKYVAPFDSNDQALEFESLWKKSLSDWEISWPGDNDSYPMVDTFTSLLKKATLHRFLHVKLMSLDTDQAYTAALSRFGNFDIAKSLAVMQVCKRQLDLQGTKNLTFIDSCLCWNLMMKYYRILTSPIITAPSPKPETSSKTTIPTTIASLLLSNLMDPFPQNERSQADGSLELRFYLGDFTCSQNLDEMKITLLQSFSNTYSSLQSFSTDYARGSVEYVSRTLTSIKAVRREDKAYITVQTLNQCLMQVLEFNPKCQISKRDSINDQLLIARASINTILGSLLRLDFVVPDLHLDPLLETRLNSQMKTDELVIYTRELKVKATRHKILNLTLSTTSFKASTSREINIIEEFLELDHSNPRVGYLKDRCYALKQYNNHKDSSVDSTYNRLNSDMFYALQRECQKMVVTCLTRPTILSFSEYFQDFTNCLQHCDKIKVENVLKSLPEKKSKLIALEKTLHNFLLKLTFTYAEFIDIWTPFVNALIQMLIAITNLIRATSYLYDKAKRMLEHDSLKTSLWDLVLENVRIRANFEGITFSGPLIHNSCIALPSESLVNHFITNTKSANIRQTFTIFRLLLWVLRHYLNVRFLLPAPVWDTSHFKGQTMVIQKISSVYRELVERYKEVSGEAESEDWFVVRLGKEETTRSKDIETSLTQDFAFQDDTLDESTKNSKQAHQPQTTRGGGDKGLIRRNLGECLQHFKHISELLYCSKGDILGNNYDALYSNDLIMNQLSHLALSYSYNSESPIITQEQDSSLLLHHLQWLCAREQGMGQPPLLKDYQNKPFDPYTEPLSDPSPLKHDLAQLKNTLKILSKEIDQIAVSLGEDHPNTNELSLALGKVITVDLFRIPFANFVLALHHLIAKLQFWERGYGASFPQHSMSRFIESLEAPCNAMKYYVLESSLNRLEAVKWKLESLANFYRFDIVELLSPQADQDSSQQCKDLVAFIYDFLHKSPVGQYGARLRLLSNVCNYQKSIGPSEIIDTVISMLQYYKTFEYTIDNYIKNVQQQYTQDLKELIQKYKSRLKTIEYHALIKTFQAKLNKLQASFQGILLKNASEVIETQQTSNLNPQSPIQPFNQLSPLEYFEELVSQPLIEIGKSAATARCKLLAKAFTNHIGPKTRIQNINLFLSQMTGDVRNLGDVIGKRVVFAEEKELSYDVHHKTKMFADLYKAFYLSGMSYRKGLSLCNKNPTYFTPPNFEVFLNVQQAPPLSTTQVIESSDLCGGNESLRFLIDSSDHYCYQGLSGLLKFHEHFSKSHTQNINVDHLTRSHGIIDYLFFATNQQRNLIAQTLKPLNDLSSMLTCLKDFHIPTPDLPRRVELVHTTVKLSRSLTNLMFILGRTLALSRSIDASICTERLKHHLKVLTDFSARFNEQLLRNKRLSGLIKTDSSPLESAKTSFEILPLCTQTQCRTLETCFRYLQNELLPYMTELSATIEGSLFGQDASDDEINDDGPIAMALHSCTAQLKALILESNLAFEPSPECFIKSEIVHTNPDFPVVEHVTCVIKKLVKYMELPDVGAMLKLYDADDYYQQLTRFQSIPFADSLFQKLLLIANPTQISKSLSNVFEEIYATQSRLFTNPESMAFLTQIIEVYCKTLGHLLEQYLGFHVSLCQLLCYSTELFNNYVTKGLGCQLKSKNSSKGDQNGNLKPSDTTEYNDAENCGMGEGQGVKNVSDQIENMDQIEDAKPQGMDDEMNTADGNSSKPDNPRGSNDKNEADFNEDAIELPEDDTDFKDDGNFEYEKNYSCDRDEAENNGTDELQNVFDQKEYDGSLDQQEISDNEDFLNNLDEELNKEGPEENKDDSSKMNENPAKEQPLNDSKQTPVSSTAGQNSSGTDQQSVEGCNEENGESEKQQSMDGAQQKSQGEPSLGRKDDIEFEADDGLNGDSDQVMDPNQGDQPSVDDFNTNSEIRDANQTEDLGQAQESEPVNDEGTGEKTDNLPLENAELDEMCKDKGDIESEEIASAEIVEDSMTGDVLEEKGEVNNGKEDELLPQNDRNEAQTSSPPAQERLGDEFQQFNSLNIEDDENAGGEGSKQSNDEKGQFGSCAINNEGEDMGEGSAAMPKANQGKGGSKSTGEMAIDESNADETRMEKDSAALEESKTEKSRQNKRDKPSVQKNKVGKKGGSRSKDEQNKLASGTAFDILSDDEKDFENTSNLSDLELEENALAEFNDEYDAENMEYAAKESALNKLKDDGAKTVSGFGENGATIEELNEIDLDPTLDTMEIDDLGTKEVTITCRDDEKRDPSKGKSVDTESKHYENLSILNSSRFHLDENENMDSIVDLVDEEEGRKSGLKENDMLEQYLDIYHEASHQAQYLSEQLRIILEPTTASRYKGDYKTGKRLNMKKIIDYIASDYRNNKIWLRKTKLSQRDYNIIIALDDSMSMSENISHTMAIQSLSVINKAFALLEAGNLAICKFGKEVKMVQNFQKHLSDHELTRSLLDNLTFQQTTTDLANLLAFTNHYFAANTNKSSQISDSQNHENLLIIISDGRNVFGCGKENLQRAVQRTLAAGIFLVFIILDNPNTKDSIYDIRVPIFTKDLVAPIIKNYLDFFPFPFYLVIKDVSALSTVFPEALKQWFEIVASRQ